jgi:hypothetical protein
MFIGLGPSQLAAPPALVSLSMILALASGSATRAHAAWPTDSHVNLPVCTATLQQVSPITIADGQGGAIIVWTDRRNGNFDVYAQRVSGDGTAWWTSDGVAICTAAGDQEGLVAVSDGSGGAIIAWMDPRDTPYDIYAQRISGTGTIQWLADGVPICVAAGQQYFPGIVTDGAGGAIIGWSDRRNGFNLGDIYARRISGGGVPQWQADGVAVCADSSDQQTLVMTTDGAGGAIFVWMDLRDGSSAHLYAQSISSAGLTQWATDGVTISTDASSKTSPAIDSDGAGGAVVAWIDNRSGNSKTYAQRVSGAGALLWATVGVAQCTGTGNEWNPAITTDGAGGAIVTWEDDRFWNVNGGDIYAQRVSAAGTIQWTAPGVTVCNNIYGDQRYPRIVPDGAGGAIVSWQDSRDASYTAVDVYARKLTGAGSLQWTFSGVAVSNTTGDQIQPMIASDGGGGAIIAWQDSRNSYGDIYAQRVMEDGQLGGTTVSVPDDVPLSFSLDPAGPNPTHGGALTVRFTLESNAAASIELFDVTGRCLAAQAVGLFGAGTHTLELAEGRHLAPGVYMVRLRQGANTLVARVAVLE